MSLELCCDNHSKCSLKYLDKPDSKIDRKGDKIVINIKSANLKMLDPALYSVL